MADSRTAGALLIALMVAGCATQQRRAEPLPFHAAVIPVEIVLAQTSVPLEGSETEIELEFDSGPLSETLVGSLGQRFSKVSLLSPPAPGLLREDNHDIWLDPTNPQNWKEEHVSNPGPQQPP